MDRLQQRKSLRPRGEGSEQIKKWTGSSSSCGSPTKKISVAFEFKHNSMEQVTKTPMKMLLDEEMLKGTEVKRRSPSVIARLMGLDALPTQQPAHKQQKRTTDNCSQRVTSEGFHEKYVSHGKRSFQKNRKEKQQFKDVFEVKEASKAEKGLMQPVQKSMSTLKPGDTKMDFIRQKFMEAKRLSTDENLRQSKEFNDALEVLDSNKDLLLKFLQEPDSLFTKHLYDLQSVSTSPRSSHIRILKSSNISKYGSTDMLCESQRKMEESVQMWKDYMNTLQKYESSSARHSRYSVKFSDKSSKLPLKEKAENCLLPTRIVVLKPSFQKDQNVEGAVSSPRSLARSHSCHRRHREPRSGGRESVLEPRSRLKLVNNVENSRSKGSRGVAREITWKMRESVRSGSANVLTTRLKGYAGDDSSCSMSEDSTNDYQTSTPTSSNYYGWNNAFSPSSSYSSKSSVSREAKKRLSERLKKTHAFKEMGLANRGTSTLAEMLALPDKEKELMTLNSMIDQDGSGEWSNGKEVLERWCFPLGISSKDGWKDGFPSNLTRSRSLPTSSSLYRRPKTSTRNVTYSKDDTFLLKEATHSRSHMAIKEDFLKKKEKACPRKKVASSKRSQSLHLHSQNNAVIQEIHASPKELINTHEDKNESEQNSIIPVSSACGNGDPMQVADDFAVTESEIATLPTKVQEEQLVHTTTYTIPMNDCIDSESDQTYVIMEEEELQGDQVESHCHVLEPDSPQSSKEAEQPSPVSVLEPPFEEESSSDCFERISADLHGLRMQLQLLKLESTETITEGTQLDVASDDDVDSCGGCSYFHEEKEELTGFFNKEDNRDYNYLLNVLTDSGIHDVGCEKMFEMPCTLEFPLDQGLFENLEKKYSRQVEWPRSERRLLFDRINSVLVEIVQSLLNPHPWVKNCRRDGFMWGGKTLLEELWQLLVEHGKEGDGDTADTILRWEAGLEKVDEVDNVGREIERLLMHGLVLEIIQDLSFNGEFRILST